jgi:hypothetical protein
MIAEILLPGQAIWSDSLTSLSRKEPCYEQCLGRKAQLTACSPVGVSGATVLISRRNV